MATDKVDAKKVEEASIVPRDGIRRRSINIQRMQNVLLIRLDSNINNNNEDYSNIVTQLNQVVNTVHKFMDIDQCIDLLTNNYNEKGIMIITHVLDREVIPLIHDIDQLHAIFLICNDKKSHEQWAKEWPKIKGVFIEISPICDVLKQAAHQREQNAISISFVATNADDASSTTLDRLDPSFMYTQILKEILLTITFEEKHFKEFIHYCRQQSTDNGYELNNIEKLERTYRDHTPIYWYTWQTFLYSNLNTALRLMDVDIIVRMGFFIGDLHRHIRQLHDEQHGGDPSSTSFTVYRGQGLTKANFEQLIKTKGGLISFNNFLSTSKARDLSLTFAESNCENPDLVGILFVLTVDPSQSTTPFASISGASHFQEEDEVLFSMHSVFRINDIKPVGENNRLYEVNLTLTSDNDQDLVKLTDQIRAESVPNAEGWIRLGSMLRKMNQLDKAQDIFEILLDQTTNERAKAPIYDQLGSIKVNQGEYQEALKFYEKSLAIQQQLLPLNHPDLGGSYNNIGNVYDSMGDYPKALSSYEKSLVIQQQSLPPNHPELAIPYSNTGNVYYNMGDYPKALLSYEKSLAIQQKSLPPNHPDLASSYNNIGIVYYSMRDYPKALSSHGKALAIRQQSLPPNHPDFAYSYGNIGNVYDSMGDYPKALLSFEKVLAIQQQSLPSNHPDLASSYNNIGNVYYSMRDYPKALSSHEKAVAIRQQSLPPDHLNLASSYNSIGNIYYNVSDYLKALLSYEKVLAIRLQSLPSDHAQLADSYNNIGNVYYNVSDYPKALLSYEKVLAIRQQSLSSDHIQLADSYNNIGNVFQSMGDCLKALSFYKKVLAIRQQSLPPNHSDLGASYNNIGVVYKNMGNYSKALSCYERAVDIGQHSLPPNHPHLRQWRKNLQRVKDL